MEIHEGPGSPGCVEKTPESLFFTIEFSLNHALAKSARRQPAPAQHVQSEWGYRHRQ